MENDYPFFSSHLNSKFYNYHPIEIPNSLKIHFKKNDWENLDNTEPFVARADCKRPPLVEISFGMRTIACCTQRVELDTVVGFVASEHGELAVKT